MAGSSKKPCISAVPTLPRFSISQRYPQLQLSLWGTLSIQICPRATGEEITRRATKARARPPNLFLKLKNRPIILFVVLYICLTKCKGYIGETNRAAIVRLRETTKSRKCRRYSAETYGFSRACSFFYLEVARSTAPLPALCIRLRLCSFLRKMPSPATRTLKKTGAVRSKDRLLHTDQSAALPLSKERRRSPITYAQTLPYGSRSLHT